MGALNKTGKPKRKPHTLPLWEIEKKANALIGLERPANIRMKQLCEVEEKPFTSSFSIFLEAFWMSHFHHDISSWSAGISFKGDVNVFLLLGVSFMDADPQNRVQKRPVLRPCSILNVMNRSRWTQTTCPCGLACNRMQIPWPNHNQWLASGDTDPVLGFYKYL